MHEPSEEDAIERPGLSSAEFSSAQPAPSISRRVVAGLLLGVVSFALILRLLNFQGFAGGDDSAYIADGYLVAHGHFLPGPNQWDVRTGLIAPTALAIRLFGLHDWSITLYPMLISLLSIPLIYLLGKELFDQRVGLIAALLLACFPLDIMYASLVYPDLPAAFYGGLAVLLAYRSGKANSRRMAAYLSAGCGFCLLIAYLNWEAYIVFTPICMLATWRRNGKSGAGRVLVLLAVLAIGLVAECLLYWHAEGNALFRLTALHNHTAAQPATSLFHFIVQWPVVVFNPGYPEVFFYAVLTVWAVVALRSHIVRFEDWLTVIWLFGTCLVFAFAVIKIHPLIPLLQVEPRYLHGIQYPAVLLIAAALGNLWQRARSKQCV
ncbi:MAG TPA: glycosyltransferase family 39 protein [Chloroflexota bacterium]